MFEKRRFLPETIPTGGAPLVVAERRVPGARAHAGVLLPLRRPAGRGARLDPRRRPFSPVIVTDLDAGRTHADAGRGARRHRSAVARLRALVVGRQVADRRLPRGDRRARRGNIPLTSNIRVLMEGEEEAGSPNLEAAVRAHPDRIRADALILVDGPRHASDRPTLNFGSRGLMGATDHGLRRLARSAQRQLRQLGAESRARPGAAAGVDEAGRRPRHHRRLLRRCGAADARRSSRRSTRFRTSRRR